MKKGRAVQKKACRARSNYSESIFIHFSLKHLTSIKGIYTYLPLNSIDHFANVSLRKTVTSKKDHFEIAHFEKYVTMKMNLI